MEQNKKHYWLALLVGLLLVSPSVITGLQLDDYFHWGLVTQHQLAFPGKDAAGVFSLFTFLDGDIQRTKMIVDKGMLPWWTLPELKYTFWRPLTELTHGIDYLLWPKQPVLMHIHSLFYLLLLFVAVNKLFQRWLTGPALRWAFWVFVLSYTHGFAVGWLANRNAVLASLFVTLTLYFHERWRSGGSIRFHVLAALSFVAGLLCGELGVSAGLFLLAYALCMESSSAANNFFVRNFQHLLTILPYGLLGIGWLLGRALMGYGAEGSGHYVDPSNVAAFLEIVGWRFYQLLTGLFWSLPPEFIALFGNTVFVAVGVVGAVLLLVVFFPLLRRSSKARFFLTSLLLMLLPVCATNPHSRLLIAAAIPMAALVGLYFGMRKDPATKANFLPVAPLLSFMLIVSLLVISPLFAVVESVAMKLAMDGSLNVGAKSLQIEAADMDKTHIVLNPPLSSVAGYIQGVRAYHDLPGAKAVIPLSSAPKSVEMTVIDDATLELSSSEGLYQVEQENLLRSSSLPLRAGDQISMQEIDIQVLAVNELGAPTRARFSFKQVLENYRFHLWHKGRTAICEMPAAGTTLILTQDRDSCAL